MHEKVYVDVVVKFDIVGNIFPLSITWKDGRTFQVDRLLDIRPAASLKVGGAGIRYKCRIQNKETFLFYEEGRWFVEGRAPLKH